MFWMGRTLEGASQVLLFFKLQKLTSCSVCGNILWKQNKRSLQENEECKNYQQRTDRSGEEKQMMRHWERWGKKKKKKDSCGNSRRKCKHIQSSQTAFPLNIVAHCGLKRGSILRTLLLTVPPLSVLDFFSFVLTCFLSKHALPLSREQYFTLVSRSAAKKLVVVQRFAYLFRLTPSTP